MRHNLASELITKPRRRLLLVTVFGVLTLALSVCKFPTLFIWNITASVPRGLYLIIPGLRVRVGDLVVARLSAPVRDLASRRRYLPKNVPLIKPVAALNGDTVCRHSNAIAINGRMVGQALAVDSLARPLPIWSGCQTLGPTHVFLMNPDIRDSFDGRYFGLMPRDLIAGRAIPIWTEARSKHAPPEITSSAP